MNETFVIDKLNKYICNSNKFEYFSLCVFFLQWSCKKRQQNYVTKEYILKVHSICNDMEK